MRDLGIDDPRQIGHFEILKVLGQGGMGRVYLARRGDQPAAVKIMLDTFARDPMSKMRFRAEIEAAQRVQGDRAVKILALSSPAETRLWYASDYIAGPTLEEAVGQVLFGGPALANLAMSLQEALSAIHRAHITHRDLKPSNIILGPNGAQVIDFGIATRPGQPRMTQPGNIIGTVEFMAPEQVNSGTPQQSWDIFALGGLLAYAATGRPPFGSGNPAAVLLAITTAEPDLRGVPPEMLPLIRKCLEKRPENRATLADIVRMLPKVSSASMRSTAWMPQSVTRQVERATKLATQLVGSGKSLAPTKKEPVPQVARARPAVVSSKPKAPTPQKSKGFWGWPAVLGIALVAAAVVYGVDSGAFTGDPDSKPSTPATAPPKIEIPSASFVPSRLSGKGDLVVKKVEIEGRRVRLFVEGSDVAREKAYKDSCLKVAYARNRTGNMRPDKRNVTPDDAIDFGSGLDLAGKLSFFTTCDSSEVDLTKGQVIGIAKVAAPGFISDRAVDEPGEGRLVPIIKAAAKNGKLSVVVPDYYTYSADDYAQMCLKAAGGPLKPTVSEAEAGDRTYKVLTFNKPAGVLYTKCTGKGKKASYTGSGAKLP